LVTVNYLPYDGQGRPPTVSLLSDGVDVDPNKSGLQLVEGTPIPIYATVRDDVQAGHVELLVNGQVVQTRTSFPFNLEVVAPYQLGFIAAFAPIYLRGQAYVMLGRPREAAAQFQLILDHRGTDPFSPFHAIAPLALARASAAAGDLDDSVIAYERFLTAWARADPDLPVLLEARHEYAHLLARA
jgi:hypothetical protein